MRLQLNTYTIVDTPNEFKRIIRRQLGMRWLCGTLSHKKKLICNFPVALINMNGYLAMYSEASIDLMTQNFPNFKHVNTSES